MARPANRPSSAAVAGGLAGGWWPAGQARPPAWPACRVLGVLACPCALKFNHYYKTVLSITTKLKPLYNDLSGPHFFAYDKIVLIQMLLAWRWVRMVSSKSIVLTLLSY